MAGIRAARKASRQLGCPAIDYHKGWKCVLSNGRRRINPVAVDLLALQDICHVEDDYREIKRQLAPIHPGYDYAWTNDMTMDREQYWLDGSHYHITVGELMKQSMRESMNVEICKLLTRDTVGVALTEETGMYVN